MNTSKQTLLAVAVLAIAGCRLQTDSAMLQPSDRAPATEAEVEIDRHKLRKTGNSELSLDVDHLPPPAELGDNLTTFVVWLKPEGAEQPQNMGELEYDPNRRHGSLDILTPYDQFSLWVTAEPAATPLDRGNVVVASGDFDLRGPERGPAR